MITVAVANTLESSEQAIRFIYQVSHQNGLSVDTISPKHHAVYKRNKKVSLKHYLESLHATGKIDLLIVELTKEALGKELYQNIPFNIVVLFEGKERKMGSYRIRISSKLVENMKTHYYVLPKRIKDLTVPTVTYGWNKDADVTASSAQREIDGKFSMQCCMEGKEFGVYSSIQNTESILAGIATLRLYGMDLS